MGKIKSSGNPNVYSKSRVRSFEGVYGPETYVIVRKNSRGWDISNAVANKIYDLDLGIWGEAHLRWGKRKIDDTGKSADIDAIMFLDIGAGSGYGIICDGNLDVITLPKEIGPRQDGIEMTPSTEFSAVTSVYPMVSPGRL